MHIKPFLACQEDRMCWEKEEGLILQSEDRPVSTQWEGSLLLCVSPEGHWCLWKRLNFEKPI